MNKDRREKIARIGIQLNDIKQKLDVVCTDEQNSYDNIPENLLDSDRALESEEYLDGLANIIECLEKAIDGFDDLP